MTTHLLQPDAAVLEHALAIEPVLEIGGGAIQAIHSDPAAFAASDVERISGTLLPGFVDLQVNGAGGRSCDECDAEALTEVARAVARHGAAAFLPTVITAPLDRLCEQVAAIATWIDAHQSTADLATPLGIHVEGPFLVNPGAHDPDAMIDPTPAAVEQILAAGAGHVRLVTLAPSRAGAAAATAQLRDAGVTIALGHGRGADGIDECVAAGATMVTHLFNAMGKSDHRDPGMAGHVMDYPALSCSLIVDGVHVHPLRVRQATRVLGIERTILVTDAISAMGMPDGEFTLGGAKVTSREGTVRNADGTLAGSALAMFDAVSNFRAAVPDAGSWSLSRVAAANPADAIGAAGYGRIAVGARARFAVSELDGTWRSLTR